VKRDIAVLVTDLDNTLFDWFDIWYTSFSAMLNEIVRISNLPIEVLEREIKTVHEKHGTSEYAFLIEELPSLAANHPSQNVMEIYAPAIDAYREARRSRLVLYPSVRETLEHIKASGTLVVGYTESLEFYTTYRLIKLDLDGLLDFVYFPPDHALPEGLDANQIRHYDADAYRLRSTQTRRTPKGETKPNPKLLGHILDQCGADKERTAYVGDKLDKDVRMAQAAGVLDVYAKYGDTVGDERYELLRRVTHWRSASVETERQTTQETVSPTYTLEQSFAQLLQRFNFTPFAKPSVADAV
jgi:phosphoglycolate phosphatase-like HAD superfamily hydrolase